MFRFRWMALVLFVSTAAYSQTFRGSITGTVSDPQGAVISGVAVQLTNPATGTVIKQTTGSSGDFNFPELPVGIYSLNAASPGFATTKIDNINVEVSKVLNIPIKLALGQESTVVDVVTNGVQTDTTSNQLVTVIDSKAVAEMPMNGRDFTKMTHYATGAQLLSNSINGSRTTGINFQVDGADNVDNWNGIVASNQGGIAGVAGGLIPIEAIDQFSMQAAGEADSGRNAGANSNMVLKSGTNTIHGDVFYFDRNEFFAAISPVAPVGSRKPLIRNHQGGFTLGGPVWKDHTFLFLAGEIQIAKINTALTDTVLTDAWINDGTAFLAKYGLKPNQLSQNLYGLLFPANSKTGPATTSNYFAQGAANYNSYNGIIKLDHHFSDKQTLSVRYLGTTGTQTAPYNGNDYAQYFQTAPMHVHNFSVVHNYTFTPNLLNQLILGTNYFLQTFNDIDQNFYPQKNAGLNLGITNPIVAQGATTLTFSGSFDTSGATQPSGRTDVTGHITDSLHWTIGRHALKFGGEYRHGNVNQLYFSSSRGTFAFDGTRGPWNMGSSTDKTNCATIPVPQVTSTGACNQNILVLADFLNGQPTNSSGARLLQGNAQRVWTVNSEDIWAADSFQATKKLTLTYGIRWTIPGAIQSAANDVYGFVPAAQNGGTAGFRLGLYPNYYKGIAPRVGFSYSPFDNNRTVLRGNYGVFYDFPAMSSWVVGSTGNGGAGYAQNNPAGPDAAVIYSQTGVQWQVNVNPFTGAVAPNVGAYGVNQNFKMPNAQVFSLGIEQQLSRTTLLTIGYAGSLGRNLEVLYDINQPMKGMGSTSSTTQGRPYSSQTSFANENAAFIGKPLQAINQLNFEAASSYHSLQVSVKQAVWKGINTTLNYTWSKSMDDASSSTTPMNSYNLHQDYGPSTFDARHNLNGSVFYTVPQWFHVVPRLTKGWQLNALYAYSTGVPISPGISTDVSRTYQLKDRPNVTPGVNPYTSLKLYSSTTSGRQYQWMTNSGNAFTTPTVGTYGNERRDAYYGPTFGTVDFSLFKHTPITEKIGTEFRAEVFNIFNINNFAAPSVSSITSSTFGLITNTRNAASAPGIGYGEPFNIQFAFKVTF